MKKSIRTYLSVALCVAALSANSAFAQVESTTTTTHSGGTITTFSPGAFSVRTEASPVPMHYSYTKTTTYVDENGNPVSVETVRSGTPVTVYYDREGDQMVARKVVLLKAPTVVTTEASPIARDSNAQVAGTVTEFTPTNFAVRTETSSTPTSYTYTKTTTYVDENGNPVSVETVRSGAPVTVYYEDENGQLVANKVVVHKVVETVPNGIVIEHKKTTTTTTTDDHQ